jgi:hypothetical protein
MVPLVACRGGTTVNITIAIDRALCARVDRLARYIQVSRSELVTSVIERALAMTIPSAMDLTEDDDQLVLPQPLQRGHTHEGAAP